MTTATMKNSPSISADDAKKVAGELAKILGDTFTLYTKTHGFHFNVEGPNFHELHILLEDQYNALWKAIDPLGERIRALGHYTPGSCGDLTSLSALQEEKGVPSPDKMLQILIDDHDTVCNRLKSAHEVADKAGDSGTTSMLEERLIEHQEMAWMLRSQAKRITGEYVVKSVMAEYS
jgi:starvation-inducible DNA-binding protein